MRHRAGTMSVFSKSLPLKTRGSPVRWVRRIEELVHVAQFQTYGVRMLPVRSGSV